MDIHFDKAFGCIPQGTHIEIPDGYVAITGKNDSGKTSLLEYIFIRLATTNGQIAKTVYISKNRDKLPTGPWPSAGDDLRSRNKLMADSLAVAGPNSLIPSDYSNHLYQILMQHGEGVSQLKKFTEKIDELGFGSYQLPQSRHTVNGIAAEVHGSGMRSIFSIVAAGVSDDIETILIDEPEISLEASRQKQLASFLQECAKHGKRIIITTHSHLFLNREKAANNLIISSAKKWIAKPAENEGDLADITFNMLGNSLDDLFLPKNFFIVEGASDQVVAEKVRDLMNLSKSDVFILSCNSVMNTEPTRQAIVNQLRPLLVSDYSPYAHRLIVLLDKEPAEFDYREIRQAIGDRLFELPVTTLEEYIPTDLYQASGLDKDEQLELLAKIKGDYPKESHLKRTISTAIANALTVENYKQLNIIVDALTRATTS